MAVAEEFADWATGLHLSDVPEEAQLAACRHLLDGLGAAIGAARLGAAEPALAVARGLGGPAEARIVGGGPKISAPAAAFATGTLVHALDFDDTHAGALVHATAATLPSAFSVGQQIGARGADILRAAVIGYELVCRVGMASPHGFHARGIHATQACGVLASAATAAALMGLDAPHLTWALGIAGSSAGGLMEFLHTGASTKQLHPGSASLAGIVAARLAAAGATGPESVIEGEYGVLATLSDRPADPSVVVNGLGSRWETTQITIKPYPACQLSHATLDAVQALPRPVDLAAIVEIVADVHPDSAQIVCHPPADKVRPRSPYDAKFSLPWSVAALLVDGQIGAATYSPESILREEVARLASKVSIVENRRDGEHAADAPGHVVVRLSDGSQVEGRVPCSSGGPARPMAEEHFQAKLRENCGGSALAEALSRAVYQLGSADSLDEVLDLADAIVGQSRPATRADSSS
jgi:2-methylcitrate dehydratase PrpD